MRIQGEEHKGAPAPHPRGHKAEAQCRALRGSPFDVTRSHLHLGKQCPHTLVETFPTQGITNIIALATPQGLLDPFLRP